MTHSYRCCERAKEIENDSKKVPSENFQRDSSNSFEIVMRLRSHIAGIMKTAILYIAHAPENIGTGFPQRRFSRIQSHAIRLKN
jgi:hypothetical protein